MRASDSEKIAFLLKQSAFDLESNIAQDSIEEKLLKLVFSLSSESIKPILDKLVYMVENNETISLIKLTDRGADSLTITDAGISQSFSVALLLGGQQNIINGRLFEVAKKWGEIGISTIQTIESSLAIKHERKPVDVFNEMIRASNRAINNSEQLRFILCFTLNNQQLLNGFTIESSCAGRSPIHQKTFYWHSETLASFIPPEVMLSKSYELFDVKEINKHVKIVESPTLDSFGSFDLPGLTHLSDPLKHKAFLKFLFDLWIRTEIPALINWQYGQNEWSKLMGFDPRSVLLDASVALPEEVVNWDAIGLLKDEQVSSFLEALGAQGANRRRCQSETKFS